MGHYDELFDMDEAERLATLKSDSIERIAKNVVANDTENLEFISKNLRFFLLFASMMRQK